MNNKKDDTELISKLLTEKKATTINFSKSLFYLLTSKPPSDYTKAKSTNSKENLIVPYSIIKKAKEAKEQNVKEIVLLASERPDKVTGVRSTLDLWGLSSYIDYLYTTSELSFLEGLAPIFEGGFLSATELKKVSEILAFIKILIPSSNLKYYEKKYNKETAKKYLSIRLKMLEWAGKLKLPIISGVIIGADNTENQTKNTINEICMFQEKYQNIHSISIQSESLLSEGSPTKKSDEAMLKAIKFIQSKNINTTISVPPIHTSNIEAFIDEGITDLGSIPINPNILFPNVKPVDFDSLDSLLSKKGLTLHQRLPIKYDYIREGKYSKKLGQVFDSYKYKIKKYEQEKLKDTKIKI